MTDTDRSISRLDGASAESDDPILAELFGRVRARGRPVLNIHRVAGLAPKLLRAQMGYTAAMREEASLPRAFQEVLILRIAQVNDSAYEQSVHRPIAASLGVPAEKIAAIADWRASPLFDAREQAALAYVEQAARTGEVDEVTFSALRGAFSPQEIVEMTALVAWYVGNSRFVRALRIVPEQEGGGPPPP